MALTQSDVVRALASPEAWHGQAVSLIETHTAYVFLVGDRAWKLKREVRYPYLDFSTPERRRRMCEAEVRLNLRTAPGLYRGVSPVTVSAGGGVEVNGDGSPVDWVVEMVRFSQDALCDVLAARGQLPLAMMDRLAAEISQFHAAAEPVFTQGGRMGMAWVIDENAEEGFGVLKDSLDQRLMLSVTSRARAWLDRVGDVLDARRAGGRVRRCHGDLHLGNIVLLDGRPVLFDGIEFNEALACTDVLYDLAFLLMDLWRRQLVHHANVVWNTYLTLGGDISGLGAMPLFLSCRAAVRAKIHATSGVLARDADIRAERIDTADAYLRLASALLEPVSPTLVAVGGLSGAGKSTAAPAIAPHLGMAPGAVVLRSDDVRKRLRGVSPLTRLGPDAYTPQENRRVYQALRDAAGEVLRHGYTVVVDASFLSSEERAAVEAVAREHRAAFLGVWLEAPADVLLARVRARTGDASDADEHVVLDQLRTQPVDVAWPRLNAAVSVQAVERQLVARLEGAYRSQ